ncbi:hypothetical protein [Acinetobacter sp. YH12090]|uniref:hypothetical protein n=1 Tax=Acinetobacter sp. YH12090 TaxID=2601081 RepID=UPI0015D36AD7|nr:hypothetical protein [Acinetobacter sp. YH12090]
MAVQEQTPLREYTANGVTTSFALGFDCEETNHLIVTIDDVEVLPTDWYLSGSNVIFLNAPGNGKLIKLQRNTPFNRLADYQSYNNSFRPPAINKEFDRVWWKLQELGVADWILGARIDALKNYVDRKDDELKAYLMEEIRKQGVALDQLDDYYNYLMERLAQIAVDKGWDASFVVDGNKNQKEINRLINSKKLIDTRLYGVIADTGADMTMPIQMAMAANPKAVEFYIPEGEVLCNIISPRSNITFVGAGLGVTKLNAFNPAKSTISYNKKLYQKLRDITVHSPHNATASIIDARDSRYIGYSYAEIYQLPDEFGVFSYSVRGLDLRQDSGYWTGYNYFKKSRFNRCMFGIDGGGNPLSATKLDDCVLAFNGYFGARLDGIVGGGMSNCDIATNGQIGIRDNLCDETQFGGVWVRGKNFNIDGAWHELNRGKFGFPPDSNGNPTDFPNDVYFHPDCVNCTETNPRSQRSSVGGYLITQSQAEQTNNAYTDVVIDGGMGTAKYQNLISNGNFKFLLTSWLNENVIAGDYSIITDDMPKGFESALRIQSAGGVKSLYQKLYESGQPGNIIDNIDRYAGQTITMTCWVKNIGSTVAGVRAGFDTAAMGTSVYFSIGSFINQTPIGTWVKVVLTHKITGTEPRLFVGFRCTSNALVCGFNVQFGSRVSDYEPKRITENGGKVLGPLDAKSITASSISVDGKDVLTTNDLQVRAASNASLISATSSINTDKRHPSFVFNTTTGKMYYSSGSAATSVWRAIDGSNDILPS